MITLDISTPKAYIEIERSVLSRLGRRQIHSTSFGLGSLLDTTRYSRSSYMVGVLVNAR